MARGTNAKAQVENRIRLEFGDDFVGSNGKDLFVWAEDGTERVQIKISLACPKTNFEGGDVPPAPTNAAPAALNWATETPAPTELSDEEKATVNELLAKLGL